MQLADIIRKIRKEETGQFPKDDDVFEETRHIVVALMQKVVYGEWLPVILGKEFVQNPRNNLNLPIRGTTYDPDVNPTIENGFATAAFRFGHSMIQGLIEIRDHNSNRVVKEEPVRDDFFNDENFVAENGVDNIIFGLTQQLAAKMDAKVTKEVTNFLFKEQGSDHGGDLVARNIQRGRDHGLGSYLAYRAKFSGKTENIECFSDVPEDIKQGDWNSLVELYKDTEDIDLFTGGLLENRVHRSILGSTFHGMIGELDTIAYMKDM